MLNVRPLILVIETIDRAHSKLTHQTYHGKVFTDPRKRLQSIKTTPSSKRPRKSYTAADYTRKSLTNTNKLDLRQKMADQCRGR